MLDLNNSNLLGYELMDRIRVMNDSFYHSILNHSLSDGFEDEVIESFFNAASELADKMEDLYQLAGSLHCHLNEIE